MSDVDHGTAPASAGSGLGPDARAELERLRAERARRKRRYFSWRPTVATILVVIALRISAVALAALIFVFWGQPTASPAQPGMAGSL